MGRGRIFIYLGLIIVLGLVAVVVIATRFPGIIGGGGGGETIVQPTPLPPEPKVTVIFTTQRIPRGGEISEDLVDEGEFPENLVLEGMFTTREDVIGLRARYDLEPGTYLSRANVVEDIEQLSTAGSLAALLIPKGMVAVSVPVNRLTSVSYGLERGDQVNVIVTMPFVDLDADFQSLLPNFNAGVIAPGTGILLTIETDESIESKLVGAGEDGGVLQNLASQSISGGSISPQGRIELDPNLNEPFYVIPSEPQRARLVSQSLIQGAIVLQLGTFALPGELELEAALAEQQAQDEAQQPEGAPPPPEEETQIPEGPEPPDIITLIVTPQDAVTLNYLVYSGGKISLALRAAEDDTRVDIEAVTLQFLLDEYNIPVPAKLPFGTLPKIENMIEPPVLQNDIPPATEE